MALKKLVPRTRRVRVVVEYDVDLLGYVVTAARRVDGAFMTDSEVGHLRAALRTGEAVLARKRGKA